jgi:hypothetical protein
MVIGTALALVFAVAHLLGGSGAGTGATVAHVTAAKETPTAKPTRSIVGPVPATTAPTTAAGGAPGSEVQPDGACTVNEVTIAPVAGSAPAGRVVPLVLQLTGIRPACTFVVDAKTVVAKVSSSNGKVWSSQDCPGAVTTQTVVVRSAAPTTIQLGWSGRGSDASCSGSTDWALPGTYQVEAAAVGSEPSQADIKLTTPPRPVVIKTIPPKAPTAITVKPGTKTGTTKTGTTKTGTAKKVGKASTADTGTRRAAG